MTFTNVPLIPCKKLLRTNITALGPLISSYVLINLMNIKLGTWISRHVSQSSSFGRGYLVSNHMTSYQSLLSSLNYTDYYIILTLQWLVPLLPLQLSYINGVGHFSLEILCKLFPSSSTIKSFQCELCQVGKHTCTVPVMLLESISVLCHHLVKAYSDI